MANETVREMFDVIACVFKEIKYGQFKTNLLKNIETSKMIKTEDIKCKH